MKNETLQLIRAVDVPRFGPLRRRSSRLGEVLVAAGVLDRSLMRSALTRRVRSSAKLGEVLQRNGLISSGTLADALAHQWQIGRVDLDLYPPDPGLLHGLDVRACLRAGCIPWREHTGTAIIAVADPDRAEEIAAAVDLPHRRIALAIAPPEAIREELVRNFASDLEREAATACPAEMSCRHWTGSAITRSVALMILAIGAALWLFPAAMGWFLVAWVVGFNAITAAIRLLGLLPVRKRRLSQAMMRREGVTPLATVRPLPSISLLVPLHREDLVLPSLVRHIRALDYPRELVDLKLLVEEGDEITRQAIAKGGYEREADVIVVPPGPVTTKPRALNYGVNFCTGDLVGILDAEDRPEPTQLRRVVEYLHTAPRDVAAVQGELDFYNTRRNWMSRCFTIEYAIWFKVLLGGMRRLGLPIPLGGTTVYFRREALEALGGWDAHNVTEDADLGIRIARMGMRTEMLPSVTWEEANSEPLPWIRQRSRWLKGYLMTWAVHMRNPARLWRDLGTKGFLSVQVTLLGGVTSYLSMPFLWLMWLGVPGFRVAEMLPAPWPVWPAIYATLLFGNAVMIAIAALAVVRSGRLHLLAVIPTMPFYWTLGAFATFKAIVEALHKPFYWDKTTHGTQSEQEERKVSALDLSFGT